MAKIMARIKDCIVINVEWHTDITKDTETLVSCGNTPVALGDSFEEGSFYRNGVKVMTLLETANMKNAEYAEALKVLGVSE